MAASLLVLPSQLSANVSSAQQILHKSLVIRMF